MNKKTLFSTLLMLVFCATAFAQTVTFEIRNEQKLGNKYTFDVFMKADQNGTYHSRGQVYINYNQDAFGEAVAANGHVTVTPLALLTETSALGTKYQTVNVADNGTTLALTWQSNFLGIAPTTAAHTSVPTAQTGLYHVEIDMKDATQAARLDFNTKLMKGQQFMLIGSNNEIPYGQGVSLPVKFINFTGTLANAHDIQLNWTTINEYNSDHFVIEKKKNDGSFAVLTRVDAQGLTQGENQYAYLDQSGMGNENYYRIKQVDFDGTFQYTETIKIELNVNDNDRFDVFPSPAVSDVTLKATTDQLDADYNFTVSDVNGKVVFTGVMAQNAGNSFSIDVSKFAAGTYYVRTVSPEGNSYLNKFVKITK